MWLDIKYMIVKKKIRKLTVNTLVNNTFLMKNAILSKLPLNALLFLFCPQYICQVKTEQYTQLSPSLRGAT